MQSIKLYIDALFGWKYRTRCNSKNGNMWMVSYWNIQEWNDTKDLHVHREVSQTLIQYNHYSWCRSFHTQQSQENSSGLHTLNTLNTHILYIYQTKLTIRILVLSLLLLHLVCVLCSVQFEIGTECVGRFVPTDLQTSSSYSLSNQTAIALWRRLYRNQRSHFQYFWTTE
jgi:hypothetical protein